MEDKNNNYESGIYGRAEVRFGGKIAIDIVSSTNNPTHGIALSELYEKSTPGTQADALKCHETQVYLIFDDMKSVEIMEQALMSVRELLKRDAEANHHK